MPTRLVMYAILGSAAVGGTALAADAFVESDTERLEALAEELEGGDAGVDAVLQWSDLSQEPISVGARRFHEGDDARLADAVSAELEALDAADLEVIQRSVVVRDDRGTIALRARADGELIDATIRVARSGQGWLVTSVRVR